MTERHESAPRIGLLSTMTPVYRNWPDIAPKMDKWRLEIVAEMEKTVTCIAPPICDSREATAAAMENIRNGDVDLLVLFPITFAPALMVLPELNNVNIPIVVLNTQIYNGWPSKVPADCFVDNQAPTGQFELTNVLVKNDIPFGFVSGHYKDPSLYQDIFEWARAAAAVRAVRKSTVGLIGYPMRGTGDFAVDHALLAHKLGPTVHDIDCAEVASLCKSAPPDVLRKQMEFDACAFDIDKGLDRETHEHASRMEYALRELVSTYHLDGITYHFNSLAADGRFAALPLLGVSKLLAEGIAFGGEGDIVSTVAVNIMQNLCGEADFFEIWGIDYDTGAVLKNHMGEGNWKFARKNEALVLGKAPFSLGKTITENAVLRFSLRQGDATFLSLTFTGDGKMKLVSGEGSVPDFPPIPGVATPHGKFKPAAELKEFLRRYAHAGGSHHGSLGYGRVNKRIEKFASITGAAYSPL